jgi:multiple sugar transport system substrate-binding protein
VSAHHGPQHELREELAQSLNDGRINRRQLVQRASLAGLSFTSIGALLSACGGSAETQQAATTAGRLSSQPMDLTLINYDWPPAHALQKFISVEYKKVRPNVTVKTELVPATQWHDAIFTQFAARKTTFDIPVLDSQMIGEAVVNGDILDLTEFIDRNIDLDAYPSRLISCYGQYPQSASGEYTAGSKLYGLPLQGDSYGYFWRKDLLGDQPPETWDDMIAMGREFQDRNPGRQSGLGFLSAPGDGAASIFMQVDWVYGGEIWDPRTKQVEGIINDARGKRAMEVLTEQMLPLMPRGSSNWYVNEINRGMAQDQIVQGLQWFAAMTGAIDPNGSKLGSTQAEILKKVGVATVPSGAADSVLQGGMGMHISSYGPNRDESLNFMKWFNEPKTQMALAKVPGLVPGRTDALQSSPFLDGAPWNPAFVRTLPRFKDYWNLPEYSKLLDVQGTRVNAALTGTQPPMEALDEIAKQQQAIMDDSRA